MTWEAVVGWLIAVLIAIFYWKTGIAEAMWFPAKEDDPKPKELSSASHFQGAEWNSRTQQWEAEKTKAGIDDMLGLPVRKVKDIEVAEIDFESYHPKPYNWK